MEQVPFANARNGARVMYLLQSGKAPAERPPSWSSCWTEGGLSEQLWSYMTRCWQPQPSQRPSVVDVVRLLTSLGYRETARDYEANQRSQLELLRTWKEPLDVLTVEALDAILARADEPDVPSNPADTAVSFTRREEWRGPQRTASPDIYDNEPSDALEKTL
ncbi:hypothetical protein H0H93_000416, partial [Arthromyces matolae]